MKNLKRLLVLLGLAVLLAGCASSPRASAADDAAAKTFSPPAGQANLYISHLNGDVFGPGYYSVVVDGKVVGDLSKGAFYLITLAPGRHSIQATGVASSQYGSNTISASKKIEVEADTNYFFELAAALGTLSLTQIADTEQGKKTVLSESRAESLIE